MPPKTPYWGCPYKDKDCPKLTNLEQDIKFLRKTVFNNQMILYIIIGMIAVNWGVALW